MYCRYNPTLGPRLSTSHADTQQLNIVLILGETSHLETETNQPLFKTTANRKPTKNQKNKKNRTNQLFICCFGVVLNWRVTVLRY
jgi:hypothetical protein